MKSFVWATVMFLLIFALGIFGIDFYLDDGTGVRIEKILDCHDVYFETEEMAYSEVTMNYTCEGDYFNFTTNPNYAWCYDFNPGNSSYTILFEHSFDVGNIPTQTIWWNETVGEWVMINESYEICDSTGAANVWFNVSGTIKHFVCDYSAWGECSVDIPNRWLECDSKYDGNADGVCTEGESCLYLTMEQAESFEQLKDTYQELMFENFEIVCERQ